MTTITIPEVFGSNSVESSSLDYIDCLDGLNAILDKVKTLSSAIGNSNVFNEKDTLMIELNAAIKQGRVISKRLEDIR